ncbi:MAG: hypothetical protein PHG06_00545 [Parabacteroides sp.]|nr:hypothetical protein [Parabacteroides sp.]
MNQIIKDELYNLTLDDLKQIKNNIESIEDIIRENNQGVITDKEAFIELPLFSRLLVKSSDRVKQCVDVINQLSKKEN